MKALHELARAAGLQIAWRDVNGAEQIVSDDSLRAVLAAIGLPAASDNEIRDSLAMLRAETAQDSSPLITATAGEPIFLPGSPGRFRLTLESGEKIEGMARRARAASFCRRCSEPGYHRLELGDRTLIAGGGAATRLHAGGCGAG